MSINFVVFSSQETIVPSQNLMPACRASFEDTQALASAILAKGSDQLTQQWCPGFMRPGQVSLRVSGDRKGNIFNVFSCHDEITTLQAEIYTCNYMISALGKSLKESASREFEINVFGCLEALK